MTQQRARVGLWLAVTAFVCVVSYRALYSLVPFGIGALIAYAMAPLVERLIRLIPIRHPNHESWRRGLGVGLVYLAFFGLVTAVALSLVPIAAAQIAHGDQQRVLLAIHRIGGDLKRAVFGWQVAARQRLHCRQAHALQRPRACLPEFLHACEPRGAYVLRLNRVRPWINATANDDDLIHGGGPGANVRLGAIEMGGDQQAGFGPRGHLGQPARNAYRVKEARRQQRHVARREVAQPIFELLGAALLRGGLADRDERLQ